MKHIKDFKASNELRCYGIKVGRKVGAFEITQKELQSIVSGVKGADYKRFPTLSEAESYVFSGEKEAHLKGSEACVCCGFEMGADRNLVNVADVAHHLKLQEDPICVHVDGSYFYLGGNSVGCGIGVFFGPESKLNQAAPLSVVTKAGPRSCFRAEIAAAVRALQILSDFYPYPVIIRSDSKVLVNAMTTNKVETWLVNGWKNSRGTAVRNWDLLEALLLLIRRRRAPVTFEYVQGHAKNLFNDMADWLAKQGAQTDIGYQYLPPLQL
ncbi:hypothetical protein L0F63_005648 [Massospora cicadina]|nr:hypothetical protein L0F63_005648 [Massospora cicadina]